MTATYNVFDYRIHVSGDVLEIMQGFTQNKSHLPESGGLLMGQVIRNDIYVTRITTPNKFDRAGRHFFERDKDAGQIQLDYEFVNSGRSIIYLGEWHTHPENIPTPSWQDRKMIEGQFQLGKLKTPFLLMLIFGIRELYVSFYDGKKITVAEQLF